MRQPRSRIPLSRRLPAGPPPAVTGSRNVSAPASIWPTTALSLLGAVRHLEGVVGMRDRLSYPRQD